MKNLSAHKMYGMLLMLMPVFCFSQETQEKCDDVNVLCSGVIIDWDRDKPLAGASITITNDKNNKTLKSTKSAANGSFSYCMDGTAMIDIRVTVTKSGYQKAEKKFTIANIRQSNNLGKIYLDTIVKTTVKPTVPVRQSKQDFVKDKLDRVNIQPTPAAYELLVYLNPGLQEKDSLMRNDEIILPKMPRLSSGEKRQNKEQYQSAKRKDGATQNRLRDTLDKVSGILSDNILQYPIKYQSVSPENFKRMRDDIRQDMQDYKDNIRRTAKLKAEELIALISKMGELQQKVILQRALPAPDYDKIKVCWADLSYLLKTNRYLMYSLDKQPGVANSMTGFITAAYMYNANVGDDDHAAAITPVPIDINTEEEESPFYEDQVGNFGILVWGEKITPKDNPDLTNPRGRYIISYFKPAFEGDRAGYTTCNTKANVALTTFTGAAKYGVEVYDTDQGKTVELVNNFFIIDSKIHESILVPNYSEVKYVVVHLKN